MNNKKNYIRLRDITHEIKINKGLKAKIVILLFRLSNYYTSRNIIIKIPGFIFMIFNKIINEIIFSVELPYKTKIKKGLKIWHPHCIVINSGCEIGYDFVIRHGCTLGANKRGRPEMFVVGNGVSMGVNSAILSDNINIGDNVIIGAGVIVFKSIEKDHYVINKQQLIINKNSQ